MPLRVMIQEFGGASITEHLQKLVFHLLSCYICHFSHCEGVVLFGLNLVCFFSFEQGHVYWRGTPSGPLRPLGVDFISSIQR